MSLTPKQSRFVEEYLVDLNGTQAAIRAGYSEKTANPQAARLLANVSIQAAIQEEKDKRSRRVEITQDRVLLELARLAFSDLREFSEWGPQGVGMKNSDELDDHAAACVQEVTKTATTSGYNTKFKLHDKCPALKMLGEHLGMYPGKLSLSLENDSNGSLAKLLGVKTEDMPE